MRFGNRLRLSNVCLSLPPPTTVPKPSGMQTSVPSFPSATSQAAVTVGGAPISVLSASTPIRTGSESNDSSFSHLLAEHHEQASNHSVSTMGTDTLASLWNNIYSSSSPLEPQGGTASTMNWKTDTDGILRSVPTYNESTAYSAHIPPTTASASGSSVFATSYKREEGDTFDLDVVTRSNSSGVLWAEGDGTGQCHQGTFGDPLSTFSSTPYHPQSSPFPFGDISLTDSMAGTLFITSFLHLFTFPHTAAFV